MNKDLFKITLLSNYDVSKTLSENILIISDTKKQVNEQNITGKTPNQIIIKPEPQKSDKLTNQNYRNKLTNIAITLLDQGKSIEDISKFLYQPFYLGKIKPNEPILYENIMYGNNMDIQSLKWKLPYTSPRLKWYEKNLNSEFKKNSCETSNQKEIYCSGNKGRNFLNEIFVKDLEDWHRFQNVPTTLEKIKNPHFLLPVFSIVVGLMTGGLGGLALAGLVDLTDAYVYYKEGRYEDAGLCAAFALIPGGFWLSKSISPNILKIIVKKIRQGIELKPIEKAIEKKLFKMWSEIEIEMFKQIYKKSLRAYFKKHKAKGIIILLLELMKKGVVSWKYGFRTNLVVGGFISVLQIGKLLGIKLEGVDYKNVPLSPEIKKLTSENVDNIVEENKPRTEQEIAIKLPEYEKDPKKRVEYINSVDSLVNDFVLNPIISNTNQTNKDLN